jgi:DNA topoisomerase-1
VLVIGLNRAVELLAKKMASVRALGPHPSGGEPVLVRKGRFGPYAQHGNRVANLPRDVAMEELTLAQAVALLAEKGKALKPRGAKGVAKKVAAPVAKPAAPKKKAPAAKTAAAPATKPAAPKRTVPAKLAAKKTAAAKKKPAAKKAPTRRAG